MLHLDLPQKKIQVTCLVMDGVVLIELKSANPAMVVMRSKTRSEARRELLSRGNKSPVIPVRCAVTCPIFLERVATTLRSTHTQVGVLNRRANETCRRKWCWYVAV